MSDYLTLAEVLAIHADQIERYGGSEGIRDAGLLEAALYRPQTGYYADLVEEAAALWESLAQNHPFVDGNKRVAFAATYTFLAINGVRLTASPEDAYAFISGLYEDGTFRFDRLAPWLRRNVEASV
ncbi:MAG: type II toxin-antitoxin system death-on-curing family toxin [Deltaproteobacteria bacterium]|nr:type II toxin-antitoxin system death-on-curing family toxin [Deltaproteobacteria bacterium]